MGDRVNQKKYICLNSLSVHNNLCLDPFPDPSAILELYIITVGAVLQGASKCPILPYVHNSKKYILKNAISYLNWQSCNSLIFGNTQLADQVNNFLQFISPINDNFFCLIMFLSTISFALAIT